MATTREFKDGDTQQVVPTCAVDVMLGEKPEGGWDLALSFELGDTPGSNPTPYFAMPLEQAAKVARDILAIADQYENRRN